MLYLVVCAAPPCQHITGLVDLLQDAGWGVQVIATPTATTWMRIDEVEQRTNHPVLHRQRHPDEPSLLPRADAIMIAPATFNTINKWAAGINDSLALGVLNESLGAELPIVASIYAKPVLTSHPAFATHLQLLREAGVRFTDIEALRPSQPDEPFRWHAVANLLADASTSS
ncbi:flavoprotein [Dactylosporangium sp. NPDC049525]|uniref:flavoprotein n=1 Tax=Dactylosporangium sp. NPDC049525 TaxID=3154730 RepID=UPI0034152D6D